MKIKICGITNLPDALAAVDAGADALGFNFYPRSPRYIAPSDASSIIEQLPATIMSVGVFVNEVAADDVSRVADSSGVKAVQLHGDESPEYCRALRDRYVIKAFRVGTDFDRQKVNEYQTDAILLDAYISGTPGGTGQTFDWKLARQVRELVPHLFLAGGLSPKNIGEAISAVNPYAVDACSSLEVAPGKKDATQMRLFVAAARLARVVS